MTQPKALTTDASATTLDALLRIATALEQLVTTTEAMGGHLHAFGERVVANAGAHRRSLVKALAIEPGSAGIAVFSQTPDGDTMTSTLCGPDGAILWTRHDPLGKHGVAKALGGVFAKTHGYTFRPAGENPVTPPVPPTVEEPPPPQDTPPKAGKQPKTPPSKANPTKPATVLPLGKNATTMPASAKLVARPPQTTKKMTEKAVRRAYLKTITPDNLRKLAAKHYDMPVDTSVSDTPGLEEMLTQEFSQTKAS